MLVLDPPSGTSCPIADALPICGTAFCCLCFARVCTNGNANHVDHAYSTDPAEISAWQALGYRVDGIEGFVYPSNLTPQSGMVKLLRRQHVSNNDTAIFPESELSTMYANLFQNTLYGVDSLGWVYPNPGYRPSY